jgi:hypothetical protein
MRRSGGRRASRLMFLDHPAFESARITAQKTKKTA